MVVAGGELRGRALVSLGTSSEDTGLVKGESEASELGCGNPDGLLFKCAGLAAINYGDMSYKCCTYLLSSFSPLVTVRSRFFKFGNV